MPGDRRGSRVDDDGSIDLRPIDFEKVGLGKAGLDHLRKGDELRSTGLAKADLQDVAVGVLTRLVFAAAVDGEGEMSSYLLNSVGVVIPSLLAAFVCLSAPIFAMVLCFFIVTKPRDERIPRQARHMTALSRFRYAPSAT